MSELIFPGGLTYAQKINPYDIVPDVALTDLNNLGKYNTSRVYDIHLDTSKITSLTNAFSNSDLTTLTGWDTSNVTNMNSMFSQCKNLVYGPDIDTRNVTITAYMFQYCTSLLTIPEYDLSNATNISGMFDNCSALKVVPHLNCKKATKWDSLFGSCSYLSKIGIIDSDSISNAERLLGYGNTTQPIEIDGFRNLGKSSSLSGTNGNYFLYAFEKLSRQSLLNIFNELYDRASAGYSVVTIKLHANHHAILTDDDKAIATNKGWALS